MINGFITAQTDFCHCTFSVYHCTFCASLRIKKCPDLIARTTRTIPKRLYARQCATCDSRSLSQRRPGHTFFELAVVKSPEFVVGISIVTGIGIILLHFWFFGYIDIFGYRSMLHSSSTPAQTPDLPLKFTYIFKVCMIAIVEILVANLGF